MLLSPSGDWKLFNVINKENIYCIWINLILFIFLCNLYFLSGSPYAQCNKLFHLLKLICYNFTPHISSVLWNLALSSLHNFRLKRNFSKYLLQCLITSSMTSKELTGKKNVVQPWFHFGILIGLSCWRMRLYGRVIFIIIEGCKCLKFDSPGDDKKVKESFWRKWLDFCVGWVGPPTRKKRIVRACRLWWLCFLL